MSFVASCLLSVICKQWLKQYNHPDVQSSLMARFQTDFMSSVWNFCCWVSGVPLHETYPSSDERGETSVFAGYQRPGYYTYNQQAGSLGCSGGGGKEGEIATMSLEFEYLYWKKVNVKCWLAEMTLVMMSTLGASFHMFLNVCLHPDSFP